MSAIASAAIKIRSLLSIAWLPKGKPSRRAACLLSLPVALGACQGQDTRAFFDPEIDAGPDASGSEAVQTTRVGTPTFRRDAGSDAEPTGAPDAGPDGSLKSFGSSLDGGLLSTESVYCGDGLRGLDEECDDGNGDDTDACTSQCRVRDFLVVPPGTPNDAGKVQTRQLGWGRHPVAAGPDGFAVVYVEPHGSDAQVGVAIFDPVGVRRQVVEVSAGTLPSFIADPVVAALPNDRYVVAWTDFGGDGDGLGIAMRWVDGATGLMSRVVYANARSDFSQSAPDILWTGSELLVAWVDDADAVRGPDVRYRTFDDSLAPQMSDGTLAGTTAAESGVSLATFTKGGWVAAWRESDAVTALERVVVTNGDLTWRTQEYRPGPAENIPAVVELDADHLGLAASVMTVPDNDQVEVPKYWQAILDAAVPGDVLVQGDGVTTGIGAYLREYRKGLARGSEYVWSAEEVPRTEGPNNDDLAIFWADWDPATGAVGGNVNAYDYLPRTPEGNLGDQRFPAIAKGMIGADESLVVVWDDHYAEPGVVQGEPDVMAQVNPLPMLRLTGDGGTP